MLLFSVIIVPVQEAVCSSWCEAERKGVEVRVMDRYKLFAAAIFSSGVVGDPEQATRRVNIGHTVISWPEMQLLINANITLCLLDV